MDPLMGVSLDILNRLAEVLRHHGWSVEAPATDGSDGDRTSRQERFPYQDPAWRLPISRRAHSYLAHFYHNRSSDPFPYDWRTSRYMRGDISAAEVASDFMADPLVFHKPGAFGPNSLLLLEKALRTSGYLEGWVSPIDIGKMRW